MRQVAFGTALVAACNLTAPAAALPPLTPWELLFQETPTAAHSGASHFPPLQSVSTKLSQKWASNDQSCLLHSPQLAQWSIISLNCSGMTTVGKGFLKLEFNNRKSPLSHIFRLYSCNHCMLSSVDLAAFCSMGSAAGLLWEMWYSAQSTAEHSACWPKIEALLSPQPPSRHQEETLWKNWLLLVMQSSLQSWRMSDLAVWSHFLVHEWWWIWRILEVMPRGLWCISCTPDRNNSTLLPYLLVGLLGANLPEVQTDKDCGAQQKPQEANIHFKP